MPIECPIVTYLHTDIVTLIVMASLTNLGAARFWLRLVRLMSFPDCAEATSLKAMKKPYKEENDTAKPCIFSIFIMHTKHY